jgi:hypothetical protein
MAGMARSSSEKRMTRHFLSIPPKRWKRMAIFHRPSRILNISSAASGAQVSPGPEDCDSCVCLLLPRVDDGQTGSQLLLQGHYTKCQARGRDECNGEIAPSIGIVSGYLSPGFAETIYKVAKTGTNWHKRPPLKLISHLCGLGHVFTSHK